MQISPKSPIPVSYTTSIPGDTTLYYVQSVLRDTATSAVIQTLNLTRESSTPNRYAGQFNPGADPSGLGRPVDVTISVYEDSAYTTLSTNYQILQINYVVLQPFIANLGNGGGGSNISYEKIVAMVLLALESNKKDPVPEISAFKFDYGPIVEMFQEISGRIDQQDVTHETWIEDFKGNLSDLKDLVEQIGGKNSEALATRMDRLEGIFGSMEERRSDLKKEIYNTLSRSLSDFKTGYQSSGTKLSKSLIDGISERFENTISDKEVHVYIPEKKEKDSIKSPHLIAAERLLGIYSPNVDSEKNIYDLM